MDIDATTRLLGLIGYPIGHSLSPEMHNRALEAAKLKYCYLPLPVTPGTLGQAITGLKAIGVRGFNVTIPYKERVMAYLDEIDAEAALIGAVNTVVNDDGHLIGYNTDGKGFLRAVQEELGFKPEGEKVVILGAGGAAKAIAAILALHGTAHLTVANRDRSRAENLVKELKDKLVADRAFTCELAAVGLTDRELDHALANGRLVVQTTPVGMYPRIEAEPVIDPGRLSPRNLVYDIIFNPRQTRFLAEANKRGCKTANGMGMLLHQGALAFELWTKEQAPLTVMRDALAAAQ